MRNWQGCDLMCQKNIFIPAHWQQPLFKVDKGKSVISELHCANSRRHETYSFKLELRISTDLLSRFIDFMKETDERNRIFASFFA